MASISAKDFIARWRASKLTERSASQSHFNDLCEVLGEPKPTDVDPDGTWYTFERGAKKTGGGDGWADVWKKGHFAWEYKGKHKDLDAALRQLKLYADALDNPPLLIVSDMETIRIHTNFTNSVVDVRVINLNDLDMPDTIRVLKWVFTDPERLRPGTTRDAITQQAADGFAGLAERLRDRGHNPQRVAHFVTKLLFCMFAEDIEILPKGLFLKILENGAKDPARFEPMAKTLFQAMQTGGFFGADAIDWFNGGLFDDDDILLLDKQDLDQVLRVARLDWSDIEPSIFGTLFERGLDPDKRSQLGAHYTDRQSIMRIVEPVVLRPLWAEWEATKADIATMLMKANSAKAKGAATKARNEALLKYDRFRQRLADFRVLDPACGSGNFLYLSLLGLKDLENKVILDAEAMSLPRAFPLVGPQCVLGIELNPYAAELARVTIWIGQIQWMLRHGWGLDKHPILQKLDQIANRDALLNGDGTEGEWPHADVIVGNPPFLGNRLLIAGLSESYMTNLRSAYRGRVPDGADLVTYWFEKARARVEAGAAGAGLVATNSIRGGRSRKVLDRILESCDIFEAWSDEPWVLEGASVRVSLICFRGKGWPGEGASLNGKRVDSIFADLTATAEKQGVDLTTARKLPQNLGVCFQGTVKSGSFDVPGPIARSWLTSPLNPNGRGNREVVKPWMNGMDLVGRPSDKWVVDFGRRDEADASLFESPFAHVLANVKPQRANVRRQQYRNKWWLFAEAQSRLMSGIAASGRYIATPMVSKHRVFVFLDSRIVPDHQLAAIGRNDETLFGILHSRFHQSWALRLGTSLVDRPRYTPTSTFETFPFPEGLTPDRLAAEYFDDPRAIEIAAAARRLNELREAWLNPPDLVKRVPEVVAGYPDRVVPVDEAAAQELKKRTLTNLYNQRPQWLAKAHQALDTAVAAAYGWEPDISDEEALRRLLALNVERANRTVSKLVGAAPAETVIEA